MASIIGILSSPAPLSLATGLPIAKVRLAPGLAQEQFGWRPATVSRILVVLASTANRDRVRRLSELLDVSFPSRGKKATAWLRTPGGRLGGLWFLSPATIPRGSPALTSPDRVRAVKGQRPT